MNNPQPMSATLMMVHEVGVILAAIGALFGAIMAAFNHRQLALNREKLAEIHVIINSRLDQLLKASLAEGRIAERDDISSGAVHSPDTPASRAASDLLVATAAETAEALVKAAHEPNK